MPDYKELYLTLMRETEAALRLLIRAQQRCEELYLEMTDDEEPQVAPLIQLFPSAEEER